MNPFLVLPLQHTHDGSQFACTHPGIQLSTIDLLLPCTHCLSDYWLNFCFEHRANYNSKRGPWRCQILSNQNGPRCIINYHRQCRPLLHKNDLSFCSLLRHALVVTCLSVLVRPLAGRSSGQSLQRQAVPIGGLLEGRHGGLLSGGDAHSRRLRHLASSVVSRGPSRWCPRQAESKQALLGTAKVTGQQCSVSFGEGV